MCIVADKIDVPGPAERLGQVSRALVEDPALVDLPERLSVFGPTRLPVDQRMILSALSANRDVHIWLPHPSPALWTKMSSRMQPRSESTIRRSEDGSALISANPLLSSLARDVRELQISLGAAEFESVHLPEPAGPKSLLATVKATSSQIVLPALQRNRMGQFRSTLATGRHGRSRCSANACSDCSRTTRHCSHATYS